MRKGIAWMVEFNYHFNLVRNKSKYETKNMK